MNLSQLPNEICSVPVGEVEISDRNIYLHAQAIASFGQCSGLGNNSHIRFTLQRQGERLSKGCVILQKEESNHIATCAHVVFKSNAKTVSSKGTEEIVNSPPWARIMRRDR